MPRAVAAKTPAVRPAKAKAAPPAHGGAVDALLERVSAEFDGLSRQLKLIARSVEDRKSVV